MASVRSLVRGPESALIARGLGRSYGDAALNSDHGVLLTGKLNCFVEFDADSGELVCEAGVTLPEILQACAPQGWFLPVTPGTKYASVGGAIGADVHGKNHHVDGSISNHVSWVELLLADGNRVRCSREENSDLFWATMGGMGLTGVILQASLRMRPIETSYLKVDYTRTNGLEETMQFLEEEDDLYRYSVAWVDCLASGNSMGRAVLMRGNHCPRAELSASASDDPLVVKDRVLLSMPVDLPGFCLNSLSIKCMNSVYYRSFKKGRSRRVEHYDPFFYPLDLVNNWNRGYGKGGFLQYQCVFPPETAKDGLHTLLKRISDSGNGSFLAILKRFGEETGLISFPMQGYTLALDFPMRGESTLRFMEELDKIVLRHGGRLYLAKDSRMSAESLRQMYPKLEDWLKIKREVDPEGKFSSDLSRRLGLDGVSR
jgi:decaprenylphospho-beta-D-ribofuranose 2-oxidase